MPRRTLLVTEGSDRLFLNEDPLGKGAWIMWSRQDTFAFVALLLAVAGCLATVMVPEVRDFFGLEPESSSSPPDQKGSPPATAEPASGQAGPASSADASDINTVGPQGDQAPVSSEGVSEEGDQGLLVFFKIKPGDAHLFLDGRFMGTPETLVEGAWIYKILTCCLLSDQGT